ncbi:MAG: ATP-binding protein, partial [Pseudomonadota bacterium]
RPHKPAATRPHRDPMMVAWLMAAAAFCVAAVALWRAHRAVGAHDAAAASALACDAKVRLHEAALEHGASGAIKLAPDEQHLTIGVIPEEIAQSVAGEGPYAQAVSALLSGAPFEHALPDKGAILQGVFCDGAPTLFVKAVAQASTGDDTSARLASLVATLPHPAWIETADGTRRFTNAAYSAAVAAPAQSSDRPSAEPLLDSNAAAQLSPKDGTLARQVATIVNGERKILNVTGDRQGGTLTALAIDVTDAITALRTKERALESHAATLDQLATAIAIFGPDRRLAFHNAAFQSLWNLPPAFLGQAPVEDEVLDRLRAERRLPETSDFKAWKRDQLKGYETRQSFETWWHLPDGQSLRVIASPGADGGVTYIYENVTEQLTLERRYNTLSRTQSETIDNLGEGVASFGQDGLLRLSNPAFVALTGLPSADIGTHVRDLAATAPPETAALFQTLAAKVTGLTDHRHMADGRLEQPTGRVLDYAFTPLPDGSTLATFADVTDSVNVARALMDRNNALEAADNLKNAFIEHVSYELRSPLNTIIGFTQLLTRPETGALSDRQREYANYINVSSEALLVIIDGILDLATIDAGIMELSLEEVDVEATALKVLDGLKDRIAEADLSVKTHIAPDAARFEGDAQRVRQVLYNLLSNAVSHAPAGTTITIASHREGDEVAIAVRDQGPGISADKAEAVFDRFMTSGAQGRRGGVGLGLSLVKSFVELHGGAVAVNPVAGQGAELVVRFPRFAAATPERTAA